MARFTLFGGASDTSRRIAEADSVAVIGLGRFGSSLALELMAGGTEVLGIDADEEIVQALNGELTQVVRADSTKSEVLKQLAVDEFDRVVVAIGSDITASILTCSVLLGMKIPVIWAKAVTEQHAVILEQLGVHHVIRPEAEMGRRVAHLVRGAALDYIEIEKGYAIVKTAPPARLHGVPLGQTALRKELGVTVAAFKRPGEEWRNADAETVLGPGDTVLIVGPTRKAEGFAQLR
ncbi:potassium transporter [Agromyces luteolus]|uniref:potassium channel family protein n=1 Tax=Agromyces luteolus TaxID=88373 RepID=UPI00197AE641|nr:TrkA family potassium uptake protein [Agromyces luteolus]GLK26321.1 potassium transporter [Agromyces luteolus]